MSNLHAFTKYLLYELWEPCELFQNWPESTDPEKFVYEDIAIAAYLLVSNLD